MILEKRVRIPSERIAVLIGRKGSSKAMIEQSCGVSLKVDSETGEATVTCTDAEHAAGAFAASEVVSAIGRGFSPENAMTLLDEESALHVVDLREFAGRSPAQIARVKSRIIGAGGRARRNIEALSGTSISVYGRTVSIIGRADKLRLAVDAISRLSEGSMHGSVYGRLESARRREKSERMILWEGGGPPKVRAD
ncbi:RNA-binding protein [Cenarchaeum symbiosum A]|uniref:RNA-binding protein n=1 Tax=Cenarchaeum symbiosum (strain A) TaxID=414004 RepID=A0RVP7_CENSY|nr:RNA-binding protein [Cenarchaeum symbiosum A]